jgi:hypothetical protein
MAVEARQSGTGMRRTEAARIVLIGGTIACFVGAGLLLWSRSGDVVFSNLVLNALAWCF